MEISARTSWRSSNSRVSKSTHHFHLPCDLPLHILSIYPSLTFHSTISTHPSRSTTYLHYTLTHHTVGAIMDNYYPGRVARLVVCNAPTWFYSVCMNGLSITTRPRPWSISNPLSISNLHPILLHPTLGIVGHYLFIRLTNKITLNTPY